MFAAKTSVRSNAGHRDPGPVAGPRNRRRPSELVRQGRQLALGAWTDGEFAIIGAALVNLTRDGILAIADGALRRDQRVWIRIDRATTVQTASATVLGANWLRGGRCALRLVLDEDCPVGVYETLVSVLSR